MEQNTEQVSIPMLREKIKAFLIENTSARLAWTIIDLMDSFSSVSEFLAASEGDLMAAYMSKHPKALRSIGFKTFSAIHKVREFVAGCRRDETERVAEEKAAAERKNAENPVFSKKQLKAIVDFMDYCNIELIDLKGAMQFFKSFGVENLPNCDGKARIQ